MMEETHRVFPASKAAHLDSRIRRIMVRPEWLLKKMIRPGDTVLDIGCGPGMFSRAIARMVAPSGKVIAADIQPEMLRLLENNARKEGLLPFITLHQASPDSLAFESREFINFALAYHVVHEVPDREALLWEVWDLLVPGGVLYMVEPKFVVSRKEFGETIGIAEKIGFIAKKGPLMMLSRAALFRKVAR